MASTEGGNLFVGEVKVVVVFLSMEVVLSEVNFVVLLLSKEVLLLAEEFSVLLSSAGERPPVLSREEVNKRE